MQISKLRGDEVIKGVDNLTVLDFWRWAYSDLIMNTTRGIFAEFLVGFALGITTEPRLEWDTPDLVYNGKKIQIKSAAYVQRWQQSQLSSIIFDIGEKRLSDAITGKIASDPPTRSADCYVFCLFRERDESKVDILDLGQWDFFVLSTEEIKRHFKKQKSVALNKLKHVCTGVNYANLKMEIENVLSHPIQRLF